MRHILCFGLLAALVAPAQANITVDGTLDGDYGAPLAVQTTKTGFGDAAGGSPDAGGGGGELDAGYAKVWNGRLYVMLTGNQEPNFNKMDIFIDSKAGGENTLSATPEYDFQPSPPSGPWISSNLGGLTFDSGFEADYHLFGRWGGGNYEFDIVDRAGGGSASVGGDSGAAAPATTGVIAPGAGGNNTASFISENVEFAFDNSNSAGVGGYDFTPGADNTADQVAAAAVTTGIEFSIDLDDIGSPFIGDTIRISAMYNNGDHNFLSNQILGGLPGGIDMTPNLGGDGAGNFTGDLSGVDFNQFAGLQYFELVVDEEVPEPTALVLAGLALTGVVASRRR